VTVSCAGRKGTFRPAHETETLEGKKCLSYAGVWTLYPVSWSSTFQTDFSPADLHEHTLCVKCDTTLNGPLVVHGPYGDYLWHRPNSVRETSRVENEAIFSTDLINRGTERWKEQARNVGSEPISVHFWATILHHGERGGLERERLCLSRPSYSSKNSSKMLGRRTHPTDDTDNI
jgi:NAD-dependent oxidoreductase involved in siderophore biosynthesis